MQYSNLTNTNSIYFANWYRRVIAAFVLKKVACKSGAKSLWNRPGSLEQANINIRNVIGVITLCQKKWKQWQLGLQNANKAMTLNDETRHLLPPTNPQALKKTLYAPHATTAFCDFFAGNAERAAHSILRIALMYALSHTVHVKKHAASFAHMQRFFSKLLWGCRCKHN